MGEQENRVRIDIERKYGSIPKMSAEVGLPKNTIYHALERGLDNTTTKTRQAILEPLYGERSYFVLDMSGDGGRVMTVSDEERELVEMFRALDDDTRHLVVGLIEKLVR